MGRRGKANENAKHSGTKLSGEKVEEWWLNSVSESTKQRRQHSHLRKWKCYSDFPPRHPSPHDIVVTCGMCERAIS